MNANQTDVDGAQPAQGLEFHVWPEPGEHLWGEWMLNTPRRGAKKPTQYRTCFHPKCHAVDVREHSLG